MKRAKQIKQMRQRRPIRPRNPLALDPLLKKGGPHQATGKHASRARRKAQQRRHGDGM
jgi:hypothetical protein